MFPTTGQDDAFYTLTARQWIRTSPVAESHGTKMLTALDNELERFNNATVNADPAAVTFCNQFLYELYKTAGDVMVSGMHRSITHYHVNHGQDSLGPMHVLSDEEEIQFATTYDDSDHDDVSDDDDGASSVEKPPAQTAAEIKAHKREEAKRRRQDDEQLLIKERRVRDEKNQLMATIGPFQPPRLTIRALKTGQCVPSRKTLTQRANIDFSDTDSEEEDPEAARASPPPPPEEPVDTLAQITDFLRPLSMDSLKKLSESAKVKLKAGGSQDDAVAAIVKSAVKLGCDKTCVLLDKNKLMDQVAAQAQTNRTLVMSRLADDIPGFLGALPDELVKSLGPTLGIPHALIETSAAVTVAEMWERIVALGFCLVLTHLRPRPLKKIAQELSIPLTEHGSTEKHCEQVVFHAFPRERSRMKQSKLFKRVPGVSFVMLPKRTSCFGDMGCIAFNVQHISCMRNDSERHYSPEFEFGNLRWSLLCMANKDALALYLCQQGTVHCKFIITVVNHGNQDDSVYNEGTQRFTSASAENDWGFNNVMKFDYMLNRSNGFWRPENDSITIIVGIVLVEPIVKPGKDKKDSIDETAAGGGKTDGKDKKGNNNTNNNGAGGGGGKKGKKGKKDERIVESVANQLLESERMEERKKKIKSELQRSQREEDKQRKDVTTKQLRGWQQLWDQHTNERNKLVRETQERERKEQLERQREQERLRQLHEQNEEMKRRVADLEEESADLDARKTGAEESIVELKDEIAAAEADIITAAEETVAAKKALAEIKKKQLLSDERVAVLTAEVQQLNETMKRKPPSPTPVQPSKQDTEIIQSVQRSLATLVDFE